MYSSIKPGNRVMKGNNIVEVHDALLPEYQKTKIENVSFAYTKTEEKLADIVDGTMFILPKDRYELSDASYRLHNCVKLYYLAILSKRSTIVLMERKKKLVGCIELQRGNTVVQAYGPCNTYFCEEDHKIFETWRSKHSLKGAANGWET